MTTLASEQDIISMPKVELHVHFGGNLDESLAMKLARRHGLAPAAVLALQDGKYPSSYRDFPHFLETLISVNDLVRTPDDVETVAAAIARGQAEQGVIYTELIVTALSHVRGGVSNRDLWAALRSGLSEGGPGTRINVIVDAIRNDGPADLEATLRLIDEADAPIVGVGLTGIENTWPIADFAFIRDAADQRQLGVEVHAGETGPPQSIIGSLDVLGADRIGHGVAAIYDPDLLDRLVRERVPLEICPTSNLQIKLFRSMTEHPVRHFWEAGVNMSISSDDPALMGASLTDELRSVVNVAGLTREDLAELQRRAARVAFLSSSERIALESQIDAWVCERPISNTRQ